MTPHLTLSRPYPNHMIQLLVMIDQLELLLLESEYHFVMVVHY